MMVLHQQQEVSPPHRSPQLRIYVRSSVGGLKAFIWFACRVFSLLSSSSSSSIALSRQTQPLTRKSRLWLRALSSSLSLSISLPCCLVNCICLFALHFRSVSAAKCRLSPIGRSGLRRADTTLAISAGAARWFVQRQLYQLGGPIGRVPAHRPGRGGKTLGRTQSEAKHELW